MNANVMEQMLEKYRGKRGDGESETVVVFSNSNDYVSVWSNKGTDIVSLLKRCTKEVDIREDGEGVWFKFPYENARTPAHCFKTGNTRGKTEEEEPEGE